MGSFRRDRLSCSFQDRIGQVLPLAGVLVVYICMRLSEGVARLPRLLKTLSHV